MCLYSHSPSPLDDGILTERYRGLGAEKRAEIALILDSAHSFGGQCGAIGAGKVGDGADTAQKQRARPDTRTILSGAMPGKRLAGPRRAPHG